jgi:hypothetical protein
MELDRLAPPTASPLGDLVDVIGRLLAASTRRLGPQTSPWQFAVTMTPALLAPPSLVHARHPLDTT